MCIHHFFYHNPYLFVHNPYLTSISHCDYVKRLLDFYHSQHSYKPLQILGTARQNPEALKMPEACPIHWDLGKGEQPPEIGIWRVPSWEIRENLEAHAGDQREPKRGRRRGRGRGGPRMTHSWSGADEQGGVERALGPGIQRGNVSCRIGWLENEEHHPPAQASNPMNVYQTPLTQAPLAQVPEAPRGSQLSELPASHVPASNFPAANFAAADFTAANRAALTLPPHTISPPLTLPSTAHATNIPSPAILPGMFSSYNSAPAGYPIELPTPETDIFWTGGVPWHAEGLSEDEVERMRQEEAERRGFAMGRVEEWRGKGNGDGGVDFFNNEVIRAPFEGQEPQMYAMESMEAWNRDQAVWADTPPMFPDPHLSTMEAWHGHQPAPWPNIAMTDPSASRMEAWNGDRVPAWPNTSSTEGWNTPHLPPWPTALNPTAPSFTMPPTPPHQHPIPQSPTPQNSTPQPPPHQPRNGPIIITSTASETLMQDFDWDRWERRRQWEELFGWFVAQARERVEDYAGGVKGLVGGWFVR